MPLSADTFASSFSFPKFESSQARQFVKSTLKTIVHSRLSLFSSQQIDTSHDITHWTDNIANEPFQLYIYFCTETTTHIPVEIWTLQIADPTSVVPSTENDIDSIGAASLQHSIQSFLKLLPFYSFSKHLATIPKIEYGITGGTTFIPKDNLNRFVFQVAETKYGKIAITVEYLPHADLQIDSNPILVLRTNYSSSHIKCHCAQNENNLVTSDPIIKFSVPLRPGTPPPPRGLSRSAPVGIPRPKLSIMSRPLDSGDDEEDPMEICTKVYRRHSVSLSPSELIGPFVGSFQESLLSGHMSNTPSTVYTGFVADLACFGGKKKIPFNAIFYHVEHDTPYVGTIDLAKKFKVPIKGIVQLTVINPSKTPIKTFLVKYDLSQMPAKTKTFVRQKTVQKSLLRYAVHLKFKTSKSGGKYYLYKNIRIVFAHRVPDESNDLQVLYEYPDEPKYFEYTK